MTVFTLSPSLLSQSYKGDCFDYLDVPPTELNSGEFYSLIIPTLLRSSQFRTLATWALLNQPWTDRLTGSWTLALTVWLACPAGLGTGIRISFANPMHASSWGAESLGQAFFFGLLRTTVPARSEDLLTN